jgi:hypothetical protein
MKRLAVLCCLAVAGLAAVSPAWAQTTASFSAAIDEGFGRATAHPCPVSEFYFWCGTGTIAGFGDVTSLAELTDLSGPDPETGCFNATVTRTLTFGDGSTLVLEEIGTLCQPGNAGNAPGAAKSFGNPFTIDFTWTIVSGTGRFAGASGSGTGSDRLAGDAGHAALTGTITLP